MVCLVFSLCLDLHVVFPPPVLHSGAYELWWSISTQHLSYMEMCVPSGLGQGWARDSCGRIVKRSPDVQSTSYKLLEYDDVLIKVTIGRNISCVRRKRERKLELEIILRSSKLLSFGRVISSICCCRGVLQLENNRRRRAWPDALMYEKLLRLLCFWCLRGRKLTLFYYSDTSVCRFPSIPNITNDIRAPVPPSQDLM